ncbi:hypothetical protein [Paenarthrobacter nicotinovorans]|uniref:hypothetical protein n=1 Tax=Paenarthrobacter nicotinovorans TaxID=29320 RepID=UPI001666A2EC|nr:hypothetical protein [Paenarthrobacter nicotinovorans]MBP2394479.1 hypothetical protein [Paenarthrobacter nicotinovorans]UKF04110.1 hypothetical protein JMY29_00455 [Paenarthrobacter nicotinovorans]
MPSKGTLTRERLAQPLLQPVQTSGVDAEDARPPAAVLVPSAETATIASRTTQSTQPLAAAAGAVVELVNQRCQTAGRKR